MDDAGSVGEIRPFGAVVPALARSPFPPIASYGFLSDGETMALQAPGGNIEWMCLPRPDGPSVFAAILDRGAGGFRIGPTDVAVPAGRRYLPGTIIIESTWQTGTGWLVVHDLLTVGRWTHDRERSKIHRRPPTDYDAEHCLLRIVECVNGQVEIELLCEPVFDYGRTSGVWEYTGPGYGEVAVSAPSSVHDGDLTMRLTTDLRLGIEGRAVSARTTLRENDRAFASLTWTSHPGPASLDEADARMELTADYWREWMNKGQFPDHPWRTYLQRSALTLKGLTYSPTGALLAAATTSLPENPGGERNWDYRYSWIRDTTFALWGLYTLGFETEADDFFSFVADVAPEEDLQVMYGIGGERELEERILEHLTGYEDSRPVRIGNAAYRQKQHDVWGAVLDSVYLHTRSRDHLPERVWPLLVRAVEQAIAHWREPDQGIWEVRGEPKHFTSSKLMCWVACDRGARLARIHDDPEYAEAWQAAAEEIKADILEHGVDERGVFVQHYETTALDASVLMMPLVRFLPPDDPRIRATVLAIADELTDHGMVLRYRVEETDDGLSGGEGTFAICSFWLVSAFAEIGEHERARNLCERLLAAASPLLLYAEEIDARTGRHLGNFPQAFTHLALINAVTHVIRAEEGLDTSRFTPGRPM